MFNTINKLLYNIKYMILIGGRLVEEKSLAVLFCIFGSIT